MQAEFNKWYECRKGNMPEDFDNTMNGVRMTKALIVQYNVSGYERFRVNYRMPVGVDAFGWAEFHNEEDIQSWMLPKSDFFKRNE